MNIEDILTSLELSKRLEEIGFNKDSLFYWVNGSITYDYDGCAEINDDGQWNIWKEFTKPDKSDYTLKSEPVEDIENKIINAYTASELGEILPKNFYYEKERYTIQYGWDGARTDPVWKIRLEHWLENGGRKDIEIFTDKSEANLRAKMLIYLIENNLIEL